MPSRTPRTGIDDDDVSHDPPASTGPVDPMLRRRGRFCRRHPGQACEALGLSRYQGCVFTHLGSTELHAVAAVSWRIERTVHGHGQRSIRRLTTARQCVLPDRTWSTAELCPLSGRPVPHANPMPGRCGRCRRGVVIFAADRVEDWRMQDAQFPTRARHPTPPLTSAKMTTPRRHRPHRPGIGLACGTGLPDNGHQSGGRPCAIGEDALSGSRRRLMDR